MLRDLDFCGVLVRVMRAVRAEDVSLTLGHHCRPRDFRSDLRTRRLKLQAFDVKERIRGQRNPRNQTYRPMFADHESDPTHLARISRRRTGHPATGGESGLTAKYDAGSSDAVLR